MQFEVIRKSHKKEILIGAIVFILIAIVLVVHQSFAKYQTTKNMTIVEGTINYKIPDFHIMAMYKQKEGSTCTEDNCYKEITDRMPTSGYVINESKSYCTLDNVNKDTSAKLYTYQGKHVFENLAKSEKCYIYFNKKPINGSSELIAFLTVKDSATSFTGVATSDEGVFKAKDDDGDTYYWRGAVTNNYVKFANKYWRIIRINGDGSIRMIYDGESIRENGSAFTTNTSAFNSSNNNNMYLGFKYTSGNVHGTGTESTILGQLNIWYNSNLKSYESKIDTNAGFCNDREPSTSNTASNGLGGTGTTTTYYGAYIRFIPGGTTQTPTFKCKNSSDLFTKSGATKGNKTLTNPIGLITADEVVYAGGFGGTANSSYYLYTGQTYWTLSPYDYYSSYTYPARAFVVYSDGILGINSVNYTYGIRPVINLRSDVKLTGTGTASDPYVVQ